MEPDAEWNVTRTGATIRINIEADADFSNADTDALVAFTAELLADDEVEIVQLDGPALDAHPPKSLAGRDSGP